MMNTYPPAPYPPRPPVKPRGRSKNQRVLLWIGAGAAAITVVGVMAVFALLLLLAVTPQRIQTGVAVAGVQIGGKTSADATAALQRAAQNVTLTDGSRSWTVPLANLGITLDTAATVKAAQSAPANSTVKPVYTVDLNKAQQGFIDLSDQINIAAAPGQDGRSMDIPMMLNRLRADVSGEIADGTFDLDMIVTPAPTSTPAATAYTGPTTSYTVQDGQQLALIAKDYNVSVDDIVSANNLSDADFIYPGEVLTIPAAGVYEAPPPPAPTSVGKSILVSTEEQRIFAYQDGQMVRQDLVSTGLPATPTVKGDFKIYVKYVSTDMSGPDYFLPNVPYTMYFYAGYGIHGTYWHNLFGMPMSHGCVNLPTDEAEWFFNWASVGTPVRVV
ncbi:MAG TPA: L,D-transpeptidase family protein [Phototrophicaceae bacterium]|nr:L,D-transpeptidase family protein [Phototrophicaceae bacterium]